MKPDETATPTSLKLAEDFAEMHLSCICRGAECKAEMRLATMIDAHTAAALKESTRDFEDSLAGAAEENARLRAQLPEGMEHCTIKFIECPIGHGRLTATNWLDHGCPACVNRKTVEQAEQKLAEARGLIELAKSVVESLDDDELGFGSDGTGEWPLTREVIDKFDIFLAAPPPAAAVEPKPLPLGHEFMRAIETSQLGQRGLCDQMIPNDGTRGVSNRFIHCAQPIAAHSSEGKV